MAEISLHAYLDYLEDRLSRDAYSEVVAHCRHILETYPKHIDAYKLLARALAAQDEYQDALDLFQRVLSADPSDFIAHIGMSDAYRESNALDQAIWHLERAFEQVPNNVELQEEIKKLYDQRGERVPRKIHLTSGALARMYLKGKLYDQAIAEIRAGIAKDTERLDLQVLLAEALWESRQEVNAGQVAADVLKRLPYSVDANRILAQLWLKYDRPSEARPFLERVGEIDPIQRYRIEHHGHEPPSDSFTMTMLDFTPEQFAARSGAADWVSQIGAIEKQKGVTGPLGVPARSSITDIFTTNQPEPAPAPNGEDVPDWLAGAIGGASSAPAMPAAPSEQEPDWLRDALGKPSAPAQPMTPAPSLDEAPDWLQDALTGTGTPTTPGAPPADNAPDWLQDAISGTPRTPQQAAPVTPRSTDDAPDWLQDALGSTPQPAESPVASMPGSIEIKDDDDTPDWLKEIRSESGTPAASPTLAGAEDQETPDWLSDILGSKPETTAPGLAPAATEGASVISDDWLDSFLTGGPPVTTPGSPRQTGPLSGEPGMPPPVVELPRAEAGDLETWDVPIPEDWLSEPAVEEAPKPAEPEPPHELPEWLQTDKPFETELASSLEEPEAAAELPTWLSSTPEAPPLEREEPQAAEPEAVPDWLSTAPAMSESTPAAVTSEEKEEALPDWLAGVEAASTPAPSAEKSGSLVEETGLPDWLKGEDSEQAEPTDWIAAVGESPQPAQETQPDWLAEAEKDEEALPDWMKGEEREQAEPTDWIAAVGESPQPAQETQPDWLAEAEKDEEALPDWLAGVGSDEPRQPGPIRAELPHDETPDWLQALNMENDQVTEPEAIAGVDESRELEPASPLMEEVAQVVPPNDNPQGDDGSEDLPSWLTGGDLDSDDAVKWLEEIAAKYDPNFIAGEGEKAETPEPAAAAVSAAAEDEDMPSWLTTEDTAADEELDWLRAPQEGEKTTAEQEPVAADDALPSWLSMDDEEEEEEKEAPAPVSAVVAEEDSDLPSWLKDEEEEEAAPVASAVAPSANGKDEALSWLDDQVKEQGIEPTDVVSEKLTPDHPPVPAPPVPPPDAEAVPATDDDLPEWLRNEDIEAEMEKAGTVSASEFDELPDLEVEDEELAWLEDALKAEEAVATTEAPDLDKFLSEEMEEEEKLPDWMTQEDEEAPAAAPAMVAAEEEEEPLPSWLSDTETDEEGIAEAMASITMPEPEPVPEPPMAEVPALFFEERTPHQEIALPEWLTGGSEPSTGDTGLDEFLKAAVPASREPTQTPTPAPAAPAPPKPAPLPVTGPLTPPPAPVSPMAAPVSSGPAGPGLEGARAKMSEGYPDDALTAYEELVQSGQSLDDILADLNEYVKTKRANPRAYRVMGDAMMAQGKLQDALEMYRKALDQF